MLRGAILRGRRHSRLLLLLAAAGALSLGASFGVAWAAGFDSVFDHLRNIRFWWFAAAFGAEVLAYLGYMLAYREVARVEGGPQLELPRIAALVSAGFGVFVARGGFAVDLHALQDEGCEPREARARVLGLGALEYAILAPAAAISAMVLLGDGVHKPGPGFTWPWASVRVGGAPPSATPSTPSTSSGSSSAPRVPTGSRLSSASPPTGPATSSASGRRFRPCTSPSRHLH